MLNWLLPFAWPPLILDIGWPFGWPPLTLGLLLSRIPLSLGSLLNPSFGCSWWHQGQQGFGSNQEMGSFSPLPVLVPDKTSFEGKDWKKNFQGRLSPPSPPLWWGGPWARPRCKPRPRARAEPSPQMPFATHWLFPLPASVQSPGAVQSGFVQ